MLPRLVAPSEVAVGSGRRFIMGFFVFSTGVVSECDPSSHILTEGVDRQRQLIVGSLLFPLSMCISQSVKTDA